MPRPEGKPVVARIVLLDSRYLEYQHACIATIEATLDSGLVMIVYKIQDHAFNLSKHGIGDSLLISVNTNDQPHCVHVPKQISRKELIKLLPEKWVTNYEKLHEHSQPIQSTKSQILSKGDGTTEIKFDHYHLYDPKGPSIFPTQLMMQLMGNPTVNHDKDDPECCCDLCEPGSERKLIQSFSADGKPLYMFKDENTGHCPWDRDCSCQSYVNDRQGDFPPLDEYTEKNYTHAPKISSKIQPNVSGAPVKISAAEATLNWQTENALAQNHALKKIDSKILAVEAKVDDNTNMVKDLINLLQKRLNAMVKELAAPGQYFFSHLAQGEKEIPNLKE
ncbi:hypothetical protein J1N35_012347 [Gossypium stocksii]|uniref:Uncharacterized protein n=1 Tax=Gossypium stocksii TaxID=47602 RepID=A0A9D3W3R9_9ROSI|nr:hypothetical protein J1N35_012347 [Gossypium stocksii]